MMKNWIKKIIYAVDSSEKTNFFLAAFQVIAGVAGFLSNQYKDKDFPYFNKDYLFYAFIFFQAIVFFFFVMMIGISGKYRAIKLRLRRNSGYLFDKISGIRNVALRVDTLKIILNGVEDYKKLYECGVEVGKSFYDDFDNANKLADKNYDATEKIKKWLEYDSSSGMGKFELSSTGPLQLQIKISNPFTEDCHGTRKNIRCQFLHGYLDGFLTRLYGKETKVKCEHLTNPEACKIEI